MNDDTLITIPKGNEIISDTFKYYSFDWSHIYNLGKHKFIELLQSDEKIKHIIDYSINLHVFRKAGNSQWNYNSELPVHFICKFSSPEVIKHLISLENIDLEAGDKDEWRPIHYLCRYSTLESIECITNKKINLEAVTKYKTRPIHLLCQFGSTESLKYLVDRGVNINASDIANNKPLHFSRFLSKESIIYLIDKGSDLLSKNVQGEIPIDIILLRNDKYDLIPCIINSLKINCMHTVFHKINNYILSKIDDEALLLVEPERLSKWT